MVVVSFLCRACMDRTELVWWFKGCSGIDIQSTLIILRFSTRPYVPLPIGVAQHTTIIGFSRLDYHRYCLSSLGSCPNSCSWRVCHTRGPVKHITSLRIFHFLGSCVLHFQTNVFHCPWLTGWPPSSQYWMLSTLVESLHSLKPCARRCRDTCLKLGVITSCSS
jgi:hypothetical protein